MNVTKGSRKLIIIGAGGHGRVVADIALKMQTWESIFFLDDNANIKESMGISVAGHSTEANKYINDYEIIVAIGNNTIREKIQSQLEVRGATIPTLIHPKAILGSQVDVGAGTVIMAGAIINCCSVIHKGCIINTGVTVDHDNKIEDYVHLSPGVHTSGNVRIGKGTWLGIGANVSNGLYITEECTVGAGAVVLKNITEPGIYVGVPARRIKNG